MPTSYSSVVVSRSVLSCMRIPARTRLSKVECSESICIPYSIHVGLALAMCRSFEDFPLDLAQQLFETDVCIGEGYRLQSLDRLCLRCVCENTFSQEIEKCPSNVPFVLKSKA